MFKQTVKLLFLLCILTLIYFTIHSRQNVEKEISFFNIDSSRVERIDISNSGEKVVISKQNNKWILTSPVKWEVSKDRIDLFFSKALKVKVTKNPMSEDIKNQEKYRVTPDKSIVVSLYDKQSKLIDRVFLGRSLNFSFCYARRPGSNAIYQLKDNIYDDIIPSIFLWRSPVIASINIPNLVAIDVSYSGNKYRMFMENNEWYYENSAEKFKLNPGNTATGKFFNALTVLQSYQFIDNRWSEFEPYFKKPNATLLITDRSGKKVKLTFAMDKDKLVYLMKNEEHNTLYQMNIDILNRFTLASPHFRE